MNVKELLSYAEHNISFPSSVMTVEGDVISCKKGSKGIAGRIYNQGVIRFYIPGFQFKPDHLKDMRLELSGKISNYGNELQIVASADNVVRKGKSDIYNSYVNLKSEYEKYFVKKKATKIETKKYPSQIIVIASKEHDGYLDFENQLYEKNKDCLRQYYIPTMNAENVATQLELALIQRPDMIVIVRAGKDFLFMLNDKKVLDLIVSAKKQGIYVVTGLGHSTTENLLCEDLADYAAPVPSMAGDKLNKCLYGWYKKKHTSWFDKLYSNIHTYQVIIVLLVIHIFVNIHKIKLF